MASADALVNVPFPDLLPPSACRTPDHPPYAEMIQAAIRTLAEAEGSTFFAIDQYIRAEYHDLPWGHRNLFPHYLRKLVLASEIRFSPPDRFLLSSSSSSPDDDDHHHPPPPLPPTRPPHDHASPPPRKRTRRRKRGRPKSSDALPRPSGRGDGGGGEGAPSTPTPKRRGRPPRLSSGEAGTAPSPSPRPRSERVRRRLSKAGGEIDKGLEEEKEEPFMAITDARRSEEYPVVSVMENDAFLTSIPSALDVGLPRVTEEGEPSTPDFLEASCRSGSAQAAAVSSFSPLCGGVGSSPTAGEGDRTWTQIPLGNTGCSASREIVLMEEPLESTTPLAELRRKVDGECKEVEVNPAVDLMLLSSAPARLAAAGVVLGNASSKTPFLSRRRGRPPKRGQGKAVVSGESSKRGSTLFTGASWCEGGGFLLFNNSGMMLSNYRGRGRGRGHGRGRGQGRGRGRGCGRGRSYMHPHLPGLLVHDGMFAPKHCSHENIPKARPEVLEITSSHDGFVAVQLRSPKKHIEALAESNMHKAQLELPELTPEMPVKAPEVADVTNNHSNTLLLDVNVLESVVNEVPSGDQEAQRKAPEVVLELPAPGTEAVDVFDNHGGDLPPEMKATESAGCVVGSKLLEPLPELATHNPEATDVTDDHGGAPSLEMNSTESTSRAVGSELLEPLPELATHNPKATNVTDDHGRAPSLEMNSTESPGRAVGSELLEPLPELFTHKPEETNVTDDHGRAPSLEMNSTECTGCAVGSELLEPLQELATHKPEATNVTDDLGGAPSLEMNSIESAGRAVGSELLEPLPELATHKPEATNVTDDHGGAPSLEMNSTESTGCAIGSELLEPLPELATHKPEATNVTDDHGRALSFEMNSTESTGHAVGSENQVVQCKPPELLLELPTHMPELTDITDDHGGFLLAERKEVDSMGNVAGSEEKDVQCKQLDLTQTLELPVNRPVVADGGKYNGVVLALETKPAVSAGKDVGTPKRKSQWKPPEHRPEPPKLRPRPPKH